MNDTKICPKCQVEKPLNSEFFHRNKASKSGFHGKCKTCRVAEKKEWELKNADKIKSYSESYYKENKEAISTRRKVWYAENAETIRPIEAAKQREIRKTDKHKAYKANYRKEHRVEENMRSALCNCVAGRQKNSKTFEYIGMTVEEFRTYLSSLWTEGMNWDNYGNPYGDHTYCWHIDHITPLTHFSFSSLTGHKLEQALHKAWHYSNLQPLWAKENISKGGRLDYIMKH